MNFQQFCEDTINTTNSSVPLTPEQDWIRDVLNFNVPWPTVLLNLTTEEVVELLSSSGAEELHRMFIEMLSTDHMTDNISLQQSQDVPTLYPDNANPQTFSSITVMDDQPTSTDNTSIDLVSVKSGQQKCQRKRKWDTEEPDTTDNLSPKRPKISEEVVPIVPDGEETRHQSIFSSVWCDIKCWFVGKKETYVAHSNSIGS